MVHYGKDDWRTEQSDTSTTWNENNSEGRDLLSRANQLVSEERICDNKATHTTSANARLFDNEPLQINDLRHGGRV